MKWLALAAMCVASSASASPPPIGATATLEHAVAIVNRVPVWASELDEAVALQARSRGLAKADAELTAAVLDALIDNAVVTAHAEVMHVTISDAEIDAGIAIVKQQNQFDDAALAAELAKLHIDRAAYREQIRRQLLFQKLIELELSQQISVTDDDIRRAYARTKADDPKVGKLDATLEETLRNSVRAVKLNAKADAWLAALRANAHIERRP